MTCAECDGGSNKPIEARRIWMDGCASASPPLSPFPTRSLAALCRLPEGMTFDSIPQETLEDCCQLVKANSIQGNKQKNVDIVYTPWENLRKSASVSRGRKRTERAQA